MKHLHFGMLRYKSDYNKIIMKPIFTAGAILIK